MTSNNSKNSSRNTRRLTWKSFSVGGLILILLVITWCWIRTQPQADGIPWLLRSAHHLNQKLWSQLYSQNRLTSQKSAPPGTRPRVNGDLGLTSPIDIKKWRLKVFLEDKQVQTLSLNDLKWLPLTRTATEFYCIEGWNTHFSYAGVKFLDFMKDYGISQEYRYVGLETPDREYYVSIDMESMLHPQTLLSFEMNERPLSSENGAPLRLIIPIKYGIKSLKRIGQIRFSNTKPPDYWAERGYDWYSGL